VLPQPGVRDVDMPTGKWSKHVERQWEVLRLDPEEVIVTENRRREGIDYNDDRLIPVPPWSSDVF
jgi:hypothetical protein